MQRTIVRIVGTLTVALLPALGAYVFGAWTAGSIRTWSDEAGPAGFSGAAIGLAIGTLAAWILGWWWANRYAQELARPIKDLSRAAHSASAGDWSSAQSALAAVPSRAASDDGQKGIQSLRQALVEWLDHSRRVVDGARQSGDHLVQTACDIATSARRQDQEAASLGSSTTQIAAAVQEISATGEELAATMEEVAAVSNETAKLADTSLDSLHRMEETMRQLAGATGSIAEKLALISERAEDINLIVTTINKVADQTNLLSVNAAIEAEQAGEFGMGFVVVAREIRHLADKTAAATLEIERVVTEMQSSVSAGVMAMEKFSDEVRRGVERVEGVGNQLSTIIERIQRLAPRFESISEGMKAQAQGVGQIHEAMVTLTESAQRASSTVQHFTRVTGRLEQAANQLCAQVGSFGNGSSTAEPIAVTASSAVRNTGSTEFGRERAEP